MEVDPLTAFGTVRAAFVAAWAQRWPLLAAQLGFAALFAGLLSPLIALAVQAWLALSGQSALTDQAIAGFLLSPLGAITGLAVGAFYLAVQIIGLAMLMTILGAARSGQSTGAIGAIVRLLPRFPALVVFAALLTLRVLALTLPFLAVAGGAAMWLLGPYDINYYLAESPPEFWATVGIAGVAIAAMLVVLLPRLLSWTAALPLVIFGNASSLDSFRQSVALMQGRRAAFFQRILIWLAISAALFSTIAALAGILATWAGSLAGSDIERLAILLVAVIVLTVGIGLFANTLTSGTLAGLVMDVAGWPHPAPARSVPHMVRVFLIGAATVVLGGLFLGWFVTPDTRPPGDIDVIAHRGASAERPENTMPAIELGLVDGSDWIEIDVQESADGEIIVTHDSDFMKQAGDPIKVWDVTAEDLRRIDVGAWFAPEYAGTRVPLLADVLQAADGRGKVLIELKYYGHQVALEQRVAEVVEAEDSEERVAIMSLKPEGVAMMKALRPNWSVGLLAATAVGELWKADADFLAVRGAMANAGFVRQAAAAGKDVYVWTVNDPAEMVRMATIGVAGLITDYPADARRVLADLEEIGPVGRNVIALSDWLGLD